MNSCSYRTKAEIRAILMDWERSGLASLEGSGTGAEEKVHPHVSIVYSVRS